MSKDIAAVAEEICKDVSDYVLYLDKQTELADHDIHLTPYHPFRAEPGEDLDPEALYDLLIAARNKWRPAMEDYKRRPDRRGRESVPPVAPLCAVHSLVRDFWFEQTGLESFQLYYAPEQDPPEEDDTPEEREGWPYRNTWYYSSAGRLFLGVARFLDPRYTPRHCESVYRWAKKQAQKRRERN